MTNGVGTPYKALYDVQVLNALFSFEYVCVCCFVENGVQVAFASIFLIASTCAVHG